MANNVFNQLLIEQIEIFRNSFSSVSRATFYDDERQRLIHAGEFGTYREAICRDFLRFIIPANLGISQGFLMNTEGQVSTQCDIIVYDSHFTPLIQSESRQRFFPVETVCAVGEVKSVISKMELKEALRKLATTAEMRELIKSPSIIRKNFAGTFNPVSDIYDRLFTFVICERFNFDVDGLSMNDVYGEDFPYRSRHNLILSINDGLILYRDEEITVLHPWPVVPINNVDTEQPDYFNTPTEADPHAHFKGFAIYAFMLTKSATILYPELTDYIGTTGGCARKL